VANAAAFRQTLRVAVAETLGPAARSRALAGFAKKAVADLVREGRAGESFRVFVDGRSNAPEETVKGDGTGVILYEFSYAGEAAAFALAYLRRRAPLRSGRFRDSFFVSVNGRMIRAADFDARKVPANATVFVGNTQPHNRKADVQEVGNARQASTYRRLGYSVPPNMYADAARAVSRRFGNMLTATRVRDVTFPGKYRLQNAQRRLTGKRAGTVLRGGGDYVESPALRIATR